MAEPSAETAYVFRHALMREAAYQLQPPAERARLHELALEAIPALFAGLGESALDQHAADLADHANAAAQARRDITGNLARLRELAATEAHWLQRAAAHADSAWQLEHALAYWERLAGLPGTGHALHARGRVEALVVRRRLGWSLEVVRHAPAALEAARQAGDVAAQGRVLQLLSTATLDTATPAEAETVARQALQLVGDSGDELLAARILGNLAVFLAAQRRFDEAATQYQQVLTVARRTRNWSEYATSLGNLANIGSQTGQYATAERQYRKAVALARRHGTLREISVLYDKLGIVCAYQNRHTQARRCMEQAIAHARRCGDRLVYGKALGNLATLLGESGQAEQSKVMLREALEVNRECGNYFGIAVCAINLAGPVPQGDAESAALLAEAESAARRVSAGNLLGLIQCARALAQLDSAGIEAAGRAWRQGYALIVAARAQWEADNTLASMRAFCAARGIAPFDAG